jgi:predicted nucleic acid-binding protein
MNLPDMRPYAVVLDACVLVPVVLADTLLRTAEKGLYQPLWSSRILDEAEAAIAEIHPGLDVQKRFTDMREAFDDALVTGWEEQESQIVLPDRDDRHVVAAASRAGAQAIVTCNIGDFPGSALGDLGLEAMHPDDFLLDHLDYSAPTMLRVIREQAARTRRPRITPHDLTVLLSRAGVPGFADEIRRLMSMPD